MKINCIVSLILFSVLCFGCKESVDEMPSGLIDSEVFIQILADIHIAETELVVRSASGADISKNAAAYYKEIFQQYGVTVEEFEDTFNYYSYNTEKFEIIYEQVVVELSKRQAAFRL